DHRFDPKRPTRILFVSMSEPAAASSNARDGIVGVVGAGTMGAGIAYVFALAGRRVVVAEPDQSQRESATERIGAMADASVKRGLLAGERRASVIGSIELVGSLDRIPGGCAVIVEAAPE